MKEKYMKVIVRDRQKGKTTELINLCMKIMFKGNKDILFCCGNHRMFKSVLDKIFKISQSRNIRYDQGSYEVTFEGCDRILKFCTYDDLTSNWFREKNYDNFFKVCDDLDLLIRTKFDVVTLTGGNYDE